MYELNGKISFISQVESGTSRAGNPWARQTITVDEVVTDRFTRVVAFTISGDRINDMAGLKVGDPVKVKFNISSREYQGRFYTECSVFHIEVEGASTEAPAEQAAAPAPQAPAIPETPKAPEVFTNAGEAKEDDLPF